MKEYRYNPRIFKRKVTFTGLFCAAIMLYSLFQFAAEKNATWLFIVLIAGYTVWNDFVSISNPSEVYIGEHEIVFAAYGRRDTFSLDDLTDFRVKDFPNVRKMFIRVNSPGPFRGRYWVPAAFFNDTDELYNKILDIETRMHPDSLKVMAREDARRAKRK